MLNKLCLAVVGALTVLPQTTFAANNPTGSCVDVSVPKGAIAARNGKWIELTSSSTARRLARRCRSLMSLSP